MVHSGILLYSAPQWFPLPSRCLSIWPLPSLFLSLFIPPSLFLPSQITVFFKYSDSSRGPPFPSFDPNSRAPRTTQVNQITLTVLLHIIPYPSLLAVLFWRLGGGGAHPPPLTSLAIPTLGSVRRKVVIRQSHYSTDCGVTQLHVQRKTQVTDTETARTEVGPGLRLHSPPLGVPLPISGAFLGTGEPRWNTSGPDSDRWRDDFLLNYTSQSPEHVCAFRDGRGRGGGGGGGRGVVG